MSRCINKVMLTGFVGREPEVRETNGGMKVAKLSLATSRKYRDVSETEWHRLTAFGKSADTLEKYVTKGMHLHVEGRLKTNKWQATDGTDRSSTEIIIENFVFMGSSSSDVGQIDDIPPLPANNEDINEFSDDIPF